MAEEEFAVLTAPLSMSRSSAHPERSYAKVVFVDIEETYSTDADVVCTYMMTQGEEPRLGDQVALFQVGWHDVGDSVKSVSAPVTAQHGHDRNDCNAEFQVLFSAEELPKDNEYYQLCYLAYMNSEYVVRGASVPFQFRPPDDGDLLVVDTDDMAVVRTHQGLASDLKRKIYQLKSDFTLAQRDLSETDKELHLEKAKTSLLEKKVKELEEKNEALEQKVQELDHLVQVTKHSDNHLCILRLEKELSTSNMSLEKANHTIKELDSYITELQQEKNEMREHMVKQNRKRLAETALREQDMMDALKEGKDVAVREMMAACSERDHLKQQLSEKILDMELLAEKFQALQCDHKVVLKELELRDERYQEEKAKILNEAFQDEKETLENKILKLEKSLIDGLTQITNLKKSLDNERQLRGSLELELTKAQEQGKQLQQEVQQAKCAPTTPPAPLYSVQKCAAAASEVCILSGRLSDVTNRQIQVQKQRDSVKGFLDSIRETIEAHEAKVEKLTGRVAAFKAKKDEAHDSCEATTAALHSRELSAAEMELEETKIYLESAKSRETELQERMDELEQETTVLVQQHVHLIQGLQSLNGLLSDDELVKAKDLFSMEVCQGAVKKEEEEEDGAQRESMSEMKERLRLAADSYQALYLEKIKLKKQFAKLRLKVDQQSARSSPHSSLQEPN